MNKLFAMTFFLLLLSVLTIAQEKKGSKEVHKDPPSMTGYLVDQMCGKRMVMDDIKKSDAKAARHTKDCALDEHCSANGYGLVTGGKFFKFDAAGDIQAKEFLKAIVKEDHLKVKVLGTLDGDKLNVQSIKDFPSPTVKRGKKK
jgi:hypothetical protein